jgi:ATP-dependent Clp protease ATP-binding subunit ClpC
MMFERYSDKARRVIFFARYEASEFGSPIIDTEHLLLGILRESQDLLLSVASSTAVSTIRDRIRQQVPIRDKIPTSVDLPFSESAKNSLNGAAEAADQLSNRTITPLHILLGLLRKQNCLAQKILAELGITSEGALEGGIGWLERHAPPFHPPGGVTGSAVPNAEFQKVVTDAIEEATLLRSTSARPEHLLLGLLRNEGSFAARILHEAGLDLAAVRRKLEEPQS